MYIDKRSQFSASQNITANAASTDVIDLGATRKIGPGEPMWIVIASKAAPGGTTPTLTVAVQTDDASGFGSPAAIHTTAALSATDLALGKKVVIPFPFTNERFLRLNYTVGGTNPDFTVDAWLTNQEPTSWEAQPDGI